MRSRIEVLGHPAHQIAVMFPFGALGLSLCADLLHTFTRKRRFAQAATMALNFGLVSAAAAAPFGLVDWLAIPRGTRAKRIGAWHAIGNVTVLGLFTTARLLRTSNHPSSAAKWFSAAGFFLSHATAWAGTELINRHGVGVHELAARDPQRALIAGQPEQERSL